MAHGINAWIVATLGGAIGGLIYWLVAGVVLGIGGSTPAECVAVGIATGMSYQAVRRLRRRS